MEQISAGLSLPSARVIAEAVAELYEHVWGGSPVAPDAYETRIHDGLGKPK